MDHSLLVKKMEAIYFNTIASNTMKSFLSSRKQYVTVQGVESDKLLVGNQSVVQDSTLFCTLYLIFILDMPMMFHKRRPTPQEERNCTNTNKKTYIDDHYLLVTKQQHPTLE